MDRPHSLTEALNVFQIRDTVRLSGICGSNIVAIGENLRQSSFEDPGKGYDDPKIEHFKPKWRTLCQFFDVAS